VWEYLAASSGFPGAIEALDLTAKTLSRKDQRAAKKKADQLLEEIRQQKWPFFLIGMSPSGRFPLFVSLNFMSFE